MKDKAKDID